MREMNVQGKLGIVLLTFTLGLCPLRLHAQTNLTVTGELDAATASTSAQFQLRLDGTLVAKGTFGTGSLQSGDVGSPGAEFLWYPAKAALVAGMFNGGGNFLQYPMGLNDSQIGAYSVNLGCDNAAEAVGSVAMGSGNVVEGTCSVGIGNNIFLLASDSAAFGTSNIWFGSEDFATGASDVSGGNYSSALGQSYVNGNNAFAEGAANAYANYSSAFNYYTSANGVNSASFNESTTANAYDSFVVGRYNVGAYGANGQTTWLSTDPLFEVGNGTDNTHLSDALLVDKSGNVTAKTFIVTAHTGDIPMYDGN